MNAKTTSTRTVGLACLVAAIPWQGGEPDFGQALRAIVAQEREGAWEEAVESIDTWLGRAEERELGELQRAELHYARGVVLAAVDEPERRLESVPSFGSARALAGPGELRLASTYNIAGVLLREAETWRSQIPELGGQAASGLPLPASPSGGAPPGAPPNAPPEDPPDPLKEARTAYLASKGVHLERLRSDWSDVDTRANLELIQRRLRELDEIEREREEKQKEQEQNQDPSEGEENEEQQEDGDQQESDEQQDGESGDEQKDGQNEQDEQQKEPEDSEQEGQDGEQERQTENVPQGEGEPQEGPAPGEPSERHLTREEVMRLLDRLSELEKEGQAVRSAIREARRVPVDRDW